MPDPSLGRFVRHFIPLGTTSPEYTCWTLQVGNEILGSVLTDATATKAEAWAKFQARKRWEASFWGAVEAKDADALRRIVGGGED